MNPDSATGAAPSGLRRFKSAIDSCVFPAIPEPQIGLLLSTLFQLDRSERSEAAIVRGRQGEQLERLWAHAVREAPYFRHRTGAGAKGLPRAAGIETWSRLPILTRADLQRQARHLMSETLPPGHAVIGRASSSGSTGTPVVVPTTSLTRMMWFATALRDHYWHGRDESKQLASIRIFDDGVDASYPNGARFPTWGAPISLLHETGPVAALSIHTSPEEQLEFLTRHRPDYLLTFPSNASALHALSLRRDHPFSRLAEVQLISETLDPELRTAIRETWGARVTDAYSAQEVGYIALQCPENDHYHVQSENVYVEVVDERGEPCAPGQIGRVLVTSLHNFAMPLIRYEIGDFAEVGEPCDCGRTLPVLKRILGRVRNMLVLPDGSRRWPRLAAPFYREIAPVVQHQIVQHDLRRIEARLVVERPLTRAEEGRLREVIAERLGHPFDIRFSYPDRIARDPSGKYEEFKSALAQAR